MSKHICKEKREEVKSQFTCRFGWGSEPWCGKVIRCSDCNEKINYRLSCSRESCPHYEPRKWYKWRGWAPWRYKDNP